MAVEVKKSKITHLLQQKMKKDLTITGESKIRYVRKEIRVYRSTPEYVYLPYRYLAEVCDIPFPNRKRELPLIDPYCINFDLRPYQDEVKDYSLKAYRERGTVVWNVFCSFGKTRLGIYFASIFSQAKIPLLEGKISFPGGEPGPHPLSKVSRLLTMVVVPPNRKILEGWQRTFLTCTNIRKLAILGESPITPETQAIIAMKGRLPQLTNAEADRIGHLLLDEADCLATQITIDDLLRIRPHFITCCTATYERADGLHLAMNRIVGEEKIRKISTKPFFVIKIPTPFTPKDYKTTANGIQWDSVQKCYDDMVERNGLILKLVIDNPLEKILILTLHQEHAENIHAWLLEYKQQASIMCGNRKSYHDARVLVGTFSKLGRGFDEEAACQDWNKIRLSLLIFAASTKQVEQYAGRVFRSKQPKILDLVDKFRNNKDHYRVRETWYKERGGIIIERKPEKPIIWQEILAELIEQGRKVGLTALDCYLSPNHGRIALEYLLEEDVLGWL
jgi:hypothetical protein